MFFYVFFSRFFMFFPMFFTLFYVSNISRDCLDLRSHDAHGGREGPARWNGVREKGGHPGVRISGKRNEHRA
jgi:hypothetical protein